MLKLRYLCIASLLASSLGQAADEMPAVTYKLNKPWDNAVLFAFGQKKMDDSDMAWWGSDSQSELGVTLLSRRDYSSVSLVFDYLFADDEVGEFEPGVAGFDGKVSTHEFNIGIRKDFAGQKKWGPYAAIGLGFISGKQQIDILDGGGATVLRASDNDMGVGPWGEIGVMTSWEQIYLGLGFKYSTADITLLDEDVDAGGQHYTANVGFMW